MLLGVDETVLAQVNAYAVLGALPALAEIAPEAAEILRRVGDEITLTVRVRRVPTVSYRFGPTSVVRVDDPGRGPQLLFASPTHFAATLAGRAMPIPVTGPAGLRFLTSVFTPLCELLEKYLKPSEEDLSDPEFSAASTRLTLVVAMLAVAVVANEDRSGRFSAAHMPDGTLDVEAGDDIRIRLQVDAHRVRVVDDLDGPPRARLRFADLATVGDVLAGRDSALACVCDGRIAMSGFIPLVDNTNRILDRVGAYLKA
nr:hypothetical protein ISGA_3543 [Gordonia sp. NB41Y]